VVVVVMVQARWSTIGFQEEHFYTRSIEDIVDHSMRGEASRHTGTWVTFMYMKLLVPDGRMLHKKTVRALKDGKSEREWS